MSDEVSKEVMPIANGPVVTIRKLIEAGAHFGHYTKKWDPRMREYIYTPKNGIYIINLEHTKARIEEAYQVLKKIVNDGGKILFVCTSQLCGEIVREEALRCGAFYVTNRWLGGTLTNFKTIQRRIKYLASLKEMLDDGSLAHLSKREEAKIRKTIIKLESNLGGIKEMRKVPNAIFVVDPNGEEIAVREARKLRIPVFGICDTNSNPTLLNYVIPANDNSPRTVRLITQILADAILEGRGSGELVAAYSPLEGDDATMIEALRNVEAYEEKRALIAAQNARRDDRFNRRRRPNNGPRPNTNNTNNPTNSEAAAAPAAPAPELVNEAASNEAVVEPTAAPVVADNTATPTEGEN